MSRLVHAWKRYGIPILAVLFLVGWFRFGTTHWYENAMFGGLMLLAAAGVKLWATARSRALQGAAIIVAMSCLSAVWAAQWSEQGRDILLLAAALALMVAYTAQTVALMHKA
jgi:hypothetical protein